MICISYKAPGYIYVKDVYMDIMLMYIETKQLFYSYKVDASGETIARWVYGSDATKLLSVHVAEHRDYNLYYYMQWRRFRVASGGDGSSHLHLATLLVSESWQQLCSVASFLVLGRGGGASPPNVPT